MSDTVDTIVLENSRVFRKIRCTNISDGSGESAVVKVDRSALTDLNGLEPRRLNVLYIKWAIQGFSSVRLHWDAATDDEIAVLTGVGERVYDPPLKDPLSGTNVGDILFTTAGAVSGATYDIELWVQLERRNS